MRRRLTIFIVNNVSGDDKFNGRMTTDATANSGPVRTISRALRLARRGDRIFVQKTERPYSESITLQGSRNSGTDVMPFAIISDGAVLDGTLAMPLGSWEHVRGSVFRFMPRLKSFQQLYLDGKPLPRIPVENRFEVPLLQAGEWALANGWIYFCTDGNRIPDQYDLRYCGYQTGVTLYEVHNVVIDGLVVQGFQLDGVNAHDGVSRTEIRNCKLRGNGRSGLSVGGASRLQLRASVVGANGNSQLRSEGYCALSVFDCRLLESDTTGPAIDHQGGKISLDGQEYRQAVLSSRRR